MAEHQHLSSVLCNQTDEGIGNAAIQAPEIQTGLNTSASFIDVKSAVVPWFEAAMDSTQTVAGMMSGVVSTNKSL